MFSGTLRSCLRRATLHIDPRICAQIVGGLGVAAAVTAAPMGLRPAPAENKHASSQIHRLVSRCEEGDFEKLVQAVGEGADTEIDLSKRAEDLKKRQDAQFIFQTLMEGERRIKRIRMWHSSPKGSNGDRQPLEPDTAEGLTRLVAAVEIGDELNGHIDIVHGGFTAALLDELLGWASAYEGRAQLGEISGLFTANLSVDYRAPIPANGAYVIEVEVQKVVRSKKVYLKAVVKDAVGKIYAEANSLYILKR